MCVICDAKVGFQAQDHLVISNCYKITKIPKIGGLLHVRVFNCPNLRSIVIAESVETVCVEKCPAFVYLGLDPGATNIDTLTYRECASIAILPTIRSKSRLVAIILKKCDSLTFLPHYQFTRANMQHPTGIYCQSCPLLEISHRYGRVAVPFYPNGTWNASRSSGRHSRSWAQRARNRVAAKVRRAAEALDQPLLPPLVAIVLAYFESH